VRCMGKCGVSHFGSSNLCFQQLACHAISASAELLVFSTGGYRQNVNVDKIWSSARAVIYRVMRDGISGSVYVHQCECSVNRALATRQ